MAKEKKQPTPEFDPGVNAKPADDLSFTAIRESWQKWDFVNTDVFIGKFTGETQTLESAGVPDDSGNAGDIVLMGFQEYSTGVKYGIIRSGILEKIDFVKGKVYKIVFEGQKKSQKTGRKINIFNVYVAG